MVSSRMRRIGWLLVGLFAAALDPAMAWPACPGECPVPGGGTRGSECFVEFDGLLLNAPAHRPRYVRCVDGDTACDRDGVANGACSFAISACFNNFDGRFPPCNPQRTIYFEVDRGSADDRWFDPERAALQSAGGGLLRDEGLDVTACTPRVPWTVELRSGPRGYQPTSEVLRTLAYGVVPREKLRLDRDTVKVLCVPSPG